MASLPFLDDSTSASGDWRSRARVREVKADRGRSVLDGWRRRHAPGHGVSAPPILRLRSRQHDIGMARTVGLKENAAPASRAVRAAPKSRQLVEAMTSAHSLSTNSRSPRRIVPRTCRSRSLTPSSARVSARARRRSRLQHATAAASGLCARGMSFGRVTMRARRRRSCAWSGATRRSGCRRWRARCTEAGATFPGPASPCSTCVLRDARTSLRIEVEMPLGRESAAPPTHRVRARAAALKPQPDDAPSPGG